MDSSIRLRCPICGARIKAPVQLIGQERSCPSCGFAITIRKPPPLDAGPVLLDVDSRELAGVDPDEKLILLVDDDVELNDGLRTVLENQGYRVVQAFDGAQAKEIATARRPDLMILDMMMPRMGGYPLLEHFHKAPEAPPIIMITAKEGEQHKVYAEYLGVVDYLRKPFPIERFLQSVKKGLGDGAGEGAGTAAG